MLQVSEIPSPFSFSRHARRRAQQRGVVESRLREALELFDLDRECGGGSYALTLSADAASSLLRNGRAPQDVDRLRRLRIVVADDGTVVTIMHRYKRASHRRAVDFYEGKR